MAKKVTKKFAVKKAAPAKKAAKAAPTKKAAAPIAAKKVATKAPAKKAPVNKAPAKKAVTKKAPDSGKWTTLVARVDVGFGNSLYVRGEGGELSWEKGIQMENASPYEWKFTTKAKGELSFKFLINDDMWADGDDFAVSEGGTSITSPVFNW